MIRYNLACKTGHTFDTWFRSSADYDALRGRLEVACPVCGSSDVDKAIMAPAVATAKRREARAERTARQSREMVPVANPQATEIATKRAEMIAMMRRLREEVTREAEYVGPRFAEEARKIHFDETEPRGIYGEATPSEVRDLVEDGVSVMPLPSLPEDQN